MSKQRATLGALVGAGAIAAATGVYYWLLQRPLPRIEGKVSEKGLEGPVDIWRDELGVPHIRAGNMRDLLFGQGYAHAQDRLWQMEFYRRIGTGRLAEILGSAAVPVDRATRTLGLHRVVTAEVALLTREERVELEAYVAGINAIIGRGRLPVEFTLLRHEPEPWRVADLFLWPKIMAWQLSVNWQTEVVRAALIEHLGPDLAGSLELRHDYPIIVPPGVDYGRLGDAVLRHNVTTRPFLGPPASAGLGSNGWVVSGRRTVSGAPLLASDMHLSMLMPSVWYENHLVCEETALNVTGVSMPGVPYVLAGHNGHAAWAYTNAYTDVQDLFVERLRQVDGRVEALGPEGWEIAESRRELIKVKGEPPVSLDVVTTRHGPVINSLFDRYPAGEDPLALAWTSLEPGCQLRALREMAFARDVSSLDEALRHWSGPALNVVSADADGNIAYRLAGRIPIRAGGDGRVPAQGWKGECDWIGIIPFEALPHVVNPPSGVIITANNQIVPDEYPFVLGYDYANGARATRIAELLMGQDAVDVAALARMQTDQVSAFARELAPVWHRIQTDVPEARRLLAILRGWDGHLDAASVAAAVYEQFVQEMLELALADRLGSWFAPYVGLGPSPGLAESSPFFARSREWLVHQMLRPSLPWFATADEVDALTVRALSATHERLAGAFGSDVDGWSWGDMHRLTFGHVLGAAKPLEALFNRGPFAVGGDSTTVWATGALSSRAETDLLVGPPNRLIVDLGDLRRSLSVVAPGQSGLPGSFHYDDQIEAHLAGEYHSLLHAWADVAAASTKRLRLLPADSD